MYESLLVTTPSSCTCAQLATLARPTTRRVCFSAQASSDPCGGATWLVDGFAIASSLKQRYPRSFDFFATQLLPFRCVQPGTSVEAVALPFVVDEYNDDEGDEARAAGARSPRRHRMRQFRYNDDDRAPLRVRWDRCGSGRRRRDGSLSAAQAAAFYGDHLPALLACAQDPAMALEIRLEPGERTRAEHAP